MPATSIPAVRGYDYSFSPLSSPVFSCTIMLLHPTRYRCGSAVARYRHVALRHLKFQQSNPDCPGLIRTQPAA